MATQKPKTKEQRRARRVAMQKPKKLDVDAILARMIKDVISAVDYDHAKNLDPETAEEPEYAEDELNRLVSIARDCLRPLLLPSGSQVKL